MYGHERKEREDAGVGGASKLGNCGVDGYTKSDHNQGPTRGSMRGWLREVATQHWEEECRGELSRGHIYVWPKREFRGV